MNINLLEGGRRLAKVCYVFVALCGVIASGSVAYMQFQQDAKIRYAIEMVGEPAVLFPYSCGDEDRLVSKHILTMLGPIDAQLCLRAHWFEIDQAVLIPVARIDDLIYGEPKNSSSVISYSDEELKKLDVPTKDVASVLADAYLHAFGVFVAGLAITGLALLVMHGTFRLLGWVVKGFLANSHD